MNTERLGHQHNGTDDFPALLSEIAQQSLIDLEFIEMILLQNIERRIRTAEIIEPDLIARFPELTEFLHEDIVFLDKG